MIDRFLKPHIKTFVNGLFLELTFQVWFGVSASMQPLKSILIARGEQLLHRTFFHIKDAKKKVFESKVCG